VVVTETATVTVNAAAVSASQSTVAATSPITAGSGSSTITVTARDANGNPIADATVALSASGLGNSFTPSATGTTDASGVMTVTFGPTVAEAKTITATINGTPVSQSAPVAVTAGGAAAITSNSMNPQSATAGMAVASPPSVIVRDASGNPVSGVAVTFAVASGNGSISGGTQTTNTSGIATVESWTLGPSVGTNALTATATGTGIAGHPGTFTATGTPGTVV